MADWDAARLLAISIQAGREILKLYGMEAKVETKPDHSPLTAADQKAHQIIVSGLQSAYPTIPILSEEGSQLPYDERKNWQTFWLVDPLDGTKEFINKNGEFTVNIALIKDGYPSLGFIYAPFLDLFYFGKEDFGAYKLERASEAAIANQEDLITKSARIPGIIETKVKRVVASRSHMSTETQLFIDGLKAGNHQVEVTSAGSSLKFCFVAEGKAEYYPRYAPTMEWDTAAGQAIVEAAGGKVTREKDNVRLSYNKENLKNDWFLAES